MAQLREVSIQADAALQQCLAQLQVKLTLVQPLHSHGHSAELQDSQEMAHLITSRPDAAWGSKNKCDRRATTAVL